MMTRASVGNEAPAVVYEARSGVAVITLNRPHVLNAVNAEMAHALGLALEELDSDPEVRVGILTGRGRAFCAGADLKAISNGEDISDPDHPEWGFAGIATHEVTKPIVAAVNGHALGGGFEIVLACDLAVMGSEAVLGLPEVKRGLIAGGGGAIRLPRQTPIKIAKELSLLGDFVDSDQALRWGLVNRVVADEDVLDAAVAMARVIAANAPLAVQATKRLMDASSSSREAMRELWRQNQSESESVMASADHAEGALAFVERRPPIWSGT